MAFNVVSYYDFIIDSLFLLLPTFLIGPLQLDDSLLREIRRSTDSSLAESRELIMRIEKRQLYQVRAGKLVFLLPSASCGPQLIRQDCWLG